MNNRLHVLKPLAATIAAAFLVVACSGPMTRPEAASNARNKLTRLQSDPELASRAPRAIEDAERAVRAAEEPQRDEALSEHLVLMADRKVDIAWARAQSRLAEDQRQELSADRERARLDARTREADRARSDANVARDQADAARRATENAQAEASFARTDADIAKSQADAARVDASVAQQQASMAGADADIARSQASAAGADADIARSQASAARVDSAAATERADSAGMDAAVARNEASNARSDTETARQTASAARGDADTARTQADAARADAGAARADASAARAQTDDLQRQISELNAKATNRGLVVTLGDVLFSTGTSDLKGGAANNLGKLAAFLNQFADRTVMIEGHTDNVGSADSNLGLSQRRADAVKSYLVSQGVGANRLDASGKGEVSPVAGNDSSTGRQQNRRVEVIISNAATSMR